ncbi:hypothetical protein AMS68_006800 [Peltaster fructicola]|uniref:Protein BIG1 n=1 Tax=Peltaster fructicola TaxID=286661 RepID=A0A6H0Y2N5_9PEZI|nr:hypothetical protein AMS68_006800 [Peltaster fructicola]
MMLRRITALLSLLTAAQAFKNSAPFLMLSNQALDKVMQPAEVQTSDKIESAVAQYYSDKSVCKTGRHILVSQPGLSSNDLQSMPKFGAIATSTKLPWQLTIPNVIGELDVESMRYYMEGACGSAWAITDKSWSWTSTKAKDARLSLIRGEALPSDEKARNEALEKLDARLDTILGAFPEGPYTIVLVAKPDLDESSRYEMDGPYQEVLHQELKRDTGLRARASNSSSNHTGDNFQDGLPLFERYAYFSPALFMGMSVTILLLVILYVGISAIAGLEVSYMAFSKDMAPQNQKKQQ